MSIAKVPCTIVTGFLGAGKTTLVRHVLENADGRRLAVIVNEFGDVGIDGEILKSCGVENCPEDAIVELANGCICCTVADDFVPALKSLLDRPNPPEHIVIETSGRTVALDVVDRTRAISNRTSIPSFDAEHRHPGQPVEALVDPRLRASNELLAREPVTTEALEAHLASHVGGADGYTMCMHVDGGDMTNAAMVAELPAGAPPRVWYTLGSPCQHSFRRADRSP